VSPGAVSKRNELRSDPVVCAALERWWAAACADNSGGGGAESGGESEAGAYTRPLLSST